MSSNNAASNVIPMREFDRPATTAQAVQFERLLQECRELAATRLSASVAGMLDKAEDALRGLASVATEREVRDLYSGAKDKLLAQRRVIEDRFRDGYAAEFDRRVRRDSKHEQFSQYDLSSLELGLVAEDDLEETLKINDMAAKLRRYCEEELAALDQRVGVLLGDATLQGEANPFSPQAICSAFKESCRQVESNLKVRMVFHGLFDDHVLDDIRSIYKDLNALLVQRSILPKIRYGAPRRVGVAPQAPGLPMPGAQELGAYASGPQPGELPEIARAGPSGGGQDIFAMLQGLVATSTGAPFAAAGGPMLPVGQAGGAAGSGTLQGPGRQPILSGPGAPAALHGAELLGSLTRIQHGDVSMVAGGSLPLAATLIQPGTTNVLRELKATSLASDMGQLDAMTLDIVAMLFDEIFDDANIPAAVKGLIGRLQIPTLKVALLDKTFFSRRDHPARLLLDSLGEIGLALPAEFDQESTLYNRIQAVLRKLIDGFQEDIGIFDELRVELEQLIAEENKGAEEAAARVAKRIEEKERLEVAKAVAQNEIKRRAESGKIPRSVLKFLAEHWVKLMLVAHAKHGPDSELWKTAIGTMDLLIWSVIPSKTLEERRLLAGKLPGLLKRVNAGMQMMRLDDATRKQVFVKLMRCHTKVINASIPNAATGARRSTINPASESPALPAVKSAEGVQASRAVPRPPAAPAPVPTKVAPVPTQVARVLTELAPVLTAIPGPSLDFSGTPPASAAVPSDASSAARSAPEPDEDTEPAAAAPEFSTVVIQNPFGEGEIEVEEISLSDLPGMHRAAAGANTSGGGDEHSRLASRLKEGVWVEFRTEEDVRHPARLSYISPLKGTYLFVNRQGRKTGEYSPYQLARELRSGGAVVLDAVPLFDRAMTGLVGALKGSPRKH